MFNKSCEGSTERLLQYCMGYLLSYIGTGIMVKYFTGSVFGKLPIMSELQYLVYSTAFSSLMCVLIVVGLGWYKMKSDRMISVLGIKMPHEVAYIIPSGICTAIVIPTTTLMYLLPISVMVAMTIMRASVIIISRLVDAVLIYQGILKRKVYREENIAVVFALVAASMQLLWIKPGDFDFVHNKVAMLILGSYIVAYAIRIYIMNYYRNTRPAGIQQDNKGFFAIEQFAAFTTMLLVTIGILYCSCGSNAPALVEVREAVVAPHPLWALAGAAGLFYGFGAFFSVFIFMFKGRTATFAGLVNRLTSLVAGTIATLLSHFLLGWKWPKLADWLSLGFILVAVYFLSAAEKKRSAELKAASEIEKC